MKKGFTLIELLVTMAITGILMTFVYINILRPQASTALTSGVNVLITDLRSQQLKSMTGDNDGLTATPAGVIFGTTSYTLTPQNQTISLPQNTRFSQVAYPTQQIVFATGSGEVVNYSAANNSVSLQWAGLATKRITINRYGVVSQIN